MIIILICICLFDKIRDLGFLKGCTIHDILILIGYSLCVWAVRMKLGHCGSYCWCERWKWKVVDGFDGANILVRRVIIFSMLRVFYDDDVWFFLLLVVQDLLMHLFLFFTLPGVSYLCVYVEIADFPMHGTHHDIFWFYQGVIIKE